MTSSPLQGYHQSCVHAVRVEQSIIPQRNYVLILYCLHGQTFEHLKSVGCSNQLMLEAHLR